MTPKAYRMFRRFYRFGIAIAGDVSIANASGGDEWRAYTKIMCCKCRQSVLGVKRLLARQRPVI